MGTVKSFITQPTQRVISKNFAMGVVKTAIIAPINAAISSNVIKKFSEVSAVNLTDAKDCVKGCSQKGLLKNGIKLR